MSVGCVARATEYGTAAVLVKTRRSVHGRLHPPTAQGAPVDLVDRRWSAWAEAVRVCLDSPAPQQLHSQHVLAKLMWLWPNLAFDISQ